MSAAAGGFDVDLFVIGGGSGGVRAARIAAGHGARVAIAEADRFGGTCVIRGCVPKKLMVYASRFADEFADAQGFGWHLDGQRFDWSTLIANKDREIARLEGLYAEGLDKAGVTLHRQRAVLAGPQAVRLADGRTILAAHILIATGGVARRDPAWATHPRVLVSDDMFALPALPSRLLVVGGGYIAVEFACLMHGLGVPTTLVHRGPEILRGFDHEVAAALREAMQARGIEVRLGARPLRFDSDAQGLRVDLDDGQVLDCSHALMAIGRDPATAGLGLERAGVATRANGAIAVDANSQTSVPGVYAVGDVTDRVNLTPVAIREGHAFADSVFGQRRVTVDHALIPTAVFSTPELGTVGLSETQAGAEHAAIEIYRARFRPLKATLGGNSERTLLKLIVDAPSQRVLGAHMLGPDAGEMAQLLGIAVRMKATKADFDATMAVHPTLAEEWVTMRGPPQRVDRA
jgi:glutathione reductase (NADPH)